MLGLGVDAAGAESPPSAAGGWGRARCVGLRCGQEGCGAGAVVWVQHMGS